MQEKGPADRPALKKLGQRECQDLRSQYGTKGREPPLPVVFSGRGLQVDLSGTGSRSITALRSDFSLLIGREAEGLSAGDILFAATELVTVFFLVTLKCPVWGRLAGKALRGLDKSELANLLGRTLVKTVLAGDICTAFFSNAGDFDTLDALNTFVRLDELAVGGGVFGEGVPVCVFFEDFLKIFPFFDANGF